MGLFLIVVAILIVIPLVYLRSNTCQQPEVKYYSDDELDGLDELLGLEEIDYDAELYDEIRKQNEVISNLIEEQQSIMANVNRLFGEIQEVSSEALAALNDSK